MVEVPPLLEQLEHPHVIVSPSPSDPTIVSVAVSVVPADASVTAPTSLSSVIVGALLVFATVTVAAIVTETLSSPELAVPPLSCSVVIVTTLVWPVVGDASVFLYAIASIMDSSVASAIPPASAVTVTVAVVPARTTATAMLLPPAVSATQVAEAVMSQSEPSITRNSLSS